MKAVLTAAASVLCLIGAAAADKGSFELRLDQTNGERTIAVSNLASGAVAVAAGGKRLDLLSARDADAAIKRLKQGPDLGIERRKDSNGDSSDDRAERKIIIHKMDYDDGDKPGATDNREVRILKRHQRETDSADDGADDEGSDDLFSMELDGDDEGGDDAVRERRILFINGAGAVSAAKFIDKIDGLEADEKAAMKEAVGL